MFNIVLGIASCLVGIFCISLGACAIAVCISTKDYCKEDFERKEKDEK